MPPLRDFSKFRGGPRIQWRLGSRDAVKPSFLRADCPGSPPRIPRSQDQMNKTHRGNPPYLSSHSPGPPASSQCLLVTTSQGTPAHTARELGQTFGCRGCRSACSLQTAVGRQDVQPSCGFLPTYLSQPHLTQTEVSFVVDSWGITIQVSLFLNQGLCSFGKSVRDFEIGKSGSIRVASVRGGLSSKCDLS